VRGGRAPRASRVAAVPYRDRVPGVSERFDLADEQSRETGIAEAISALARGELVVLRTDTVYGVACDAFTPDAVEALLAAKGRGRDMPVPVLVGTFAAFRALVATRGDHGDTLVDEFWPGPLTVICQQQQSVRWDLGEAQGTVGVRMPDDDLALELLTKHGPLAVSSANRSGQPPATTCDEAQAQLGDAVRVYLDGGPASGGVASTIVDLTTEPPRVLRPGAIPVERLREIVPELAADG
jgi:L-threonylcarbamoyladenylate synthase